MNNKADLQKKTLNWFVPKSISLKVLLKVVEKKLEAANDFKEILNIFEVIRSLNLKFKNERLDIYYMYFVGCIFFVGFILCTTSMVARASSKVIGYLFLVNFTFILVAIVKWNLYSRKKNYTKKISELIILKKVALDNDLAVVKGDRKKLLRKFENSFSIFHRGNYYRELARHLGSKYKNKFIYHYFNFHYVDEHYSTSTDSKGNTTTDVTYCHYNLYVIVVLFSSKNFIKISNYDKVSNVIMWKTSSISFNKKFIVYTNNEQAVALFLQPKVIEQIENLYETFPKLDIELSPHGLLALSTPDAGLINCSRKYGVDQLDLFENEIKQVLDQTKLHKALEFISFLKDYHQHM